MKYSIKETRDKDFPYQIIEDGVWKYPANSIETEFWARIQELEDCLAEIYHRTGCTTHQMELINKILPQE